MSSPASLLAPWPDLANLEIRRLEGGLINQTWQVGDPPVAVLQRLNPIFAPSVHLDIEAVTSHLVKRGLPTPRLIRTAEGSLFQETDEGCLRALRWVPGHSHHQLRDPSLAYEAGRLVARWHQATSDLSHSFHFTRPLAHDTGRHMAFMRESLQRHPRHRLYEKAAPLIEQISESWESWAGRPELPPRVAHGDLKISNLRFDSQGRGICLLDLDTMGMLPLDIELGDAFRSWCNRSAEDAHQSAFDLELFEAAAGGYLSVLRLSSEELSALPLGVERICLELAARFAADILEEGYFGWDPEVAPTRGEHNYLRVCGQLSLAASVRAQRPQMVALLEGRLGEVTEGSVDDMAPVW